MTLLLSYLWLVNIDPTYPTAHGLPQRHLNIVQGRVLDVATGEPIPFVQMEIVESKESKAVTDFDGAYLIRPNVAPGTYAGHLRAPNYVPHMDSLMVIDGRISYKDFKMVPNSR